MMMPSSSGYMTKTSSSADCGCGCGGLKKSTKFQVIYSLQGALLFFILANPSTYALTGQGVLVHSIVYFILVFLLMHISSKSPY
jgi:hypothetical protein